MTGDIDWQILDRHLAGTASTDDEAVLRRWLAGDARNAVFLERLRQGGSRDVDWNADIAWSRLAPRLEQSGSRTHSLLPRGDALVHRRRRHLRWFTAAAAAATLFAVVWPDAERSAPDRTVGPSGAPVATAAYGQQSTVTLLDGTRVRLNAGSTIRYRGEYGRAGRDVQLEGEAYFEVVHDAARPFRVYASGGVAEDLGTRFVVRAYPEHARLEVAVAEGKVALRRDRPASDSALVGPGQLGRLAPDGAITVESGVDLERWMGWTRGALILDGLTLADAARAIGRRFDVDIVVSDARLGSRTLSARFNHESLSAVLDALGVALDARWTRDGRTITIAPSPR